MFSDLDQYSKDSNGDHFKYTVTIRAFVLPSEQSGGSRASVNTVFDLIVKPFCHALVLIPPAVPDVEYEVWDQTKTLTFDEF